VSHNNHHRPAADSGPGCKRHGRRLAGNRHGIHGGAATNRSNNFTAAFADLYLNRLVSIGATVAYVMLDRDNAKSIRRDESLPITALFKVHAPIPFFQPYAGLGAALVFHDKRGATGTSVALAGGDLLFGPFFVNVE
jgi:hypothetical protein